jgi:hypothetical protein
VKGILQLQIRYGPEITMRGNIEKRAGGVRIIYCANVSHRSSNQGSRET